MRLAFLAVTVPTFLASVACDDGVNTSNSSAQRTGGLATIYSADIAGRGNIPTNIASQVPEWQNRAERFLPGPSTPEPEPTPDPEIPPAVSCENRLGAAHDALAKASADAGACQRDADCTVGFGDTGCGGMTVFAVSFVGMPGFEAAVAQIDRDMCQNIGDACPIYYVDLVGIPRSVCVEGQCELGFTHPEQRCDESVGAERPTVEGCLACDVAAAKTGAALSAALEQMNRCEVDSDCVWASEDTGCFGNCGVAINKSNVEAFAAVRADADTDYCTGGNCMLAMPGCLEQWPACNAGRCELVTW